jgi:hypothetical protein
VGKIRFTQVVGSLLVATFEDLGLRRSDIPPSCASIFLPDIERRFGRLWSGDVPRMALSLRVVEDPTISSGVVVPAKEREGFIVLFWDAYILGRERKWAMYSYSADEVKPHTGTLCRLRLRAGEEAALLLHPVDQPPIVITPWLPRSTAEQRGRVFESLASFFMEGEQSTES